MQVGEGLGWRAGGGGGRGSEGGAEAWCSEVLLRGHLN